MNNLLVLANCCFNALKYLKDSVELLVVKLVSISIFSFVWTTCKGIHPCKKEWKRENKLLDIIFVW